MILSYIPGQEMSGSNCCRTCISLPTNSCNKIIHLPIKTSCFSIGSKKWSRSVLRASMVEGSSNFAQRIERAWLISKQPTPITCSSCNSNGHVECKWCAGTGFFIIGDNMLCEVPSRNTTCVICAGKGSARCSDCKGTGFRAKWLDDPPTST